ncbi:MerR family transcriptional regulator [Bombilactobacillus bombi]|uniref:MerR family transcriptional regulator n=1 Tax=Bombilactobacillus bombi TaxID=1303590 RepID=UPI0015E59C2E|nr:MerR family transcriptional regulator [Bombilactobacillus bombi]MBA1435039.1 MerR family transcriptional regulator [Bombilactobacillus bombi]
MEEKQIRKNLAILPVSTTAKLTGLSARQLRYYEQFDLVHPKRSAGNQRLYSLNDVDCLLDIKDYLSSGMTMAQVQRVMLKQRFTKKTTEISDTTARKIFSQEMLRIGRWDTHDSNNLY